MFREFFGRKAKLDKAFQRYQELYIQQRYAEAEPFAADALRLGQEEFGIDDPNTAVFTNNLAIILRSAQASIIWRFSARTKASWRRPKYSWSAR